MRVSTFLACALVGLLAASTLKADIIVVDAGTHDVLANNTSQKIEVLVRGDGEVEALNFAVQIGDGITGNVPTIKSVDLITSGVGLLFGENNNGQGGLGSGGGDAGFKGYWEATTATAGGKVTPGAPNSILAIVEFDTTGFNAGESFELLLKGDGWGTDFAGWGGGANEDLTINNGTVNVVPEPSSFLLMFGGLAGLALVGRRRVLRKTEA